MKKILLIASAFITFSANAQWTSQITLNAASRAIIKIDIVDKKEHVAQTLNNGVWKSTFYYIPDSIIVPEGAGEFQLSIVHEFESANIVVKIKDDKGKVDSFSGYEITMKSGDAALNKSLLSKNKLLEQENQENISYSENSDVNDNTLSFQRDAIVLTPQNIKTNSSVSISRLLNNFWVGIAVFIIILGALFIFNMRKQNHGKNTRADDY